MNTISTLQNKELSQRYQHKANLIRVQCQKGRLTQSLPATNQKSALKKLSNSKFRIQGSSNRWWSSK